MVFGIPRRSFVFPMDHSVLPVDHLQSKKQRTDGKKKVPGAAGDM